MYRERIPLPSLGFMTYSPSWAIDRVFDLLIHLTSDLIVSFGL